MKQEKESCKNKGFTLIEMLVVVLIIGILAGIALPQYRKAVVKSKLAEVDLAVGAAKQNIRTYLDANGWPVAGDRGAIFTGSLRNEGSIDLPGDCDSDLTLCTTELAEYEVSCNNAYCLITIWLKFLNDDSITLVMKPDHEVWYLNRADSKETCQWAKERNYPAFSRAVTACGEEGVTLEEYEYE